MTHLVSVLMPAYRAHRVIARAVESVRAQSYQNWELVIASDDGTDYREILARAGIDDSRVRFVSTGRVGGGCPEARNTALDAATGSLLAPLDADDLWYPERLQGLVPLAVEHGAAGDNVDVIDERDDRLLGRPFPAAADAFDLALDEFIALSTPLCLVQRRELGLRWFDGVDIGEDVVFNMAVLQACGAVPVLRQPLRQYRVHPASMCHGDDGADRAEASYLRLLSRLDNDGLGIVDPVLIARLRAVIGRKIVINRLFGAAFRAGQVSSFQEFALRGRPL
ncbi:MAG: glycosyltransferase family 2 protein [Azospirillaceae bacterium]|nr:glycosyltransferase family 2 protein [Azospirillaceae bacterium]